MYYAHMKIIYSNSKLSPDCIFQDFLQIMKEKVRELDIEIHFKDTFKVFSKDKEGNFFLFPC